MNPTITILGLGNILMQDEGVGVHIVNLLQERYELPPEVEVVDGGTSGIDLLPYIQDRERVLVVDAANFDREPGHIELIENDAVPSFFSAKASLHHFGLADVLSVATLLDTSPKHLCLIGIQPKTLDLGLELTPELSDRTDAILELLINKLREWNVPCVLQSPQKSSL